MKLGGPRQPEEEVDVFLVDAPPTAATHTVTLGEDTRRRRRWPELALVLVGIAVVVGVGFLGGGDDDVDAAPETTTTTRPKTTTTRPHRRPTTTRRGPARSTTTTTWPQILAGTGPLLPGAPTGTVIGLVDGDGTVNVIDLDSGNGCRTRLSSNGAWSPWGDQTLRGRLVVQTDRAMVSVGGLCDATPIAADLQIGWLAASTPETFWLAVGESQTTYVEYASGTFEATGREVELPEFVGGAVVAVGRDLVVNVSGELTLVDPDTDDRRDLGTGYPIASFERTIALISCPELRCSLVLLDVDTGDRRVVPDVQPAMWYQAGFSPDGNLLRLSVPGDDSEQPGAAVVDVRTGKTVLVEDQVQAAVFTNDSRWIIASVNGRLAAIAVDGSGVVIQLDETFRNPQSLAVVR